MLYEVITDVVEVRGDDESSLARRVEAVAVGHERSAFGQFGRMHAGEAGLGIDDSYNFV